MKITLVCAWLFAIILKISSEQGEELRKIKNRYAVGYGSSFVYFPDGDGNLYLANLAENHEVLPSIRMDSDLQFRLYSKNGTSIIDLDSYGKPFNNETNIEQILRNKHLKVITHGWMSRANQSAVMDITRAYMRGGTGVSVVTVDWSSISVNLLYPKVASETRNVGLKVAQFLNALHKRYGLEAQTTHLIGHSLGAHVMGIAGYNSEFPIGRITGLDPALPTFDDVQKEKTRLDSNDAIFVDVLHTCGGVLGFLDAIGTADYYPNSGTAPQPGCNVFKNVFEIDACSHGRSHAYFAESIITPNAFPAYTCNYWTKDQENMCSHVGYMGEGADWGSHGIFYTITNSKKPYGRSQT